MDKGEPKVSPWTAAFTRRREIFAGRIAMVGGCHLTAVPWQQLQPACPLHEVSWASQVGYPFVINPFTRPAPCPARSQVGFSAACLWEYLLPNHPNIFQQVGNSWRHLLQFTSSCSVPCSSCDWRSSRLFP
jgi:hypothetical protein